MTQEIGIGDVLCTRSSGWPVFFIRLGAALLDRPNTVNHVIIVHHRDDNGTLWGIEGRPSGVGYVELGRHLKSAYTLNNAEQPKTEGDRFLIAKAAEKLLKAPYDWYGIFQDALLWANKTNVRRMINKDWGDEHKPPTHVVCSSFADWVYDYCNLPSPGKRFDRNVSPGDWAKFIIEKAWK